MRRKRTADEENKENNLGLSKNGEEKGYYVDNTRKR